MRIPGIVRIVPLLVLLALPAYAETVDVQGGNPDTADTKETADMPVQLKVGDELAVHLTGNPTTGFTWQATIVPDCLSLKGEAEYAQDEVPQGMAGVGGTFSFRLTATKPGTGTVRFAYARPWEKDVEPEKMVEREVQVTP